MRHVRARARPGCERSIDREYLYDELRRMMRSELVYQAGLRIENRFLLATTTMRATRRLHVSSTRTEDTVNRVLEQVASGTRLHGELPEIPPVEPIEELVTAAPAA